MASTSSEPLALRVRDRAGVTRTLHLSADAEYNLMEMLKTFDYPMRASCGGMGLCADCHCRMLDGGSRLPDPTRQELETLDELADATPDSRLACQIPPGPHLDTVYLELLGSDPY